MSHSGCRATWEWTFWLKSFWERLDHYGFKIYPPLAPPREHDKLLSSLYIQDADFSKNETIGFNCCRVAKELLWLLDATTADGRYFESLVMCPGERYGGTSSYAFPREEPSAADWIVRTIFLQGIVGRTHFSNPRVCGKNLQQGSGNDSILNTRIW